MTHAWRTDAGTITVADGALARIVVQAAEAVDGARVRRPRRHVAVEIDGSRARVELELAVAYGKVLPEVARDVQVSVGSALATMCGVDVGAVDVSVEELDS
jgi:uncharacterized alkaline shock family protein YloU